MTQQEIANYVKSDPSITDKSLAENNLIIKKCHSWEDFRKHLIKIEELAIFRKTNPDPMLRTDGVPFYRGHANARWGLKTTLERTLLLPEKYNSITTYYLLLLKIRRHLSTCGITVPDFPDTPESIKSSFLNAHGLSYLEFLSFVRHLGFPSPLLDWSRSPYIASFFAFQACDENNEPDVSIYVLLRDKYRIMSNIAGTDTMPFISDVGEYMVTHKRHFLQQSNYTVCFTQTGNNPPQKFCSYPDALSGDSWVTIFKFIVPAHEKIKALQELDKMNINAYSLYGSEEGLMGTLFNREVLFNH